MTDEPDLPTINWEYSEDGNSVRATADLNDYVHDVMRGFNARLDAALAAEIIPVLERGGYLAEHDAALQASSKPELHLEDEGPEVGHTFEIGFRVRGSGGVGDGPKRDANWWSPRQVVKVRAWNLNDALLAAEQLSLAIWYGEE